MYSKEIELFHNKRHLCSIQFKVSLSMVFIHVHITVVWLFSTRGQPRHFNTDDLQDMGLGVLSLPCTTISTLKKTRRKFQTMQ